MVKGEFSAVIKKSTKKDKKFMAIITDDKGKKITTHFGAKGMSDFTINKDPERKKRYIARHTESINRRL